MWALLPRPSQLFFSSQSSGDAVNDPLFGVLIDRIKFKKGRFLPWLRIAMPLLAVSSIFFFALPAGANPVLKIVWATVAYIAWDASYTICDVPMFILPTSMTDNIKERAKCLLWDGTLP